MEQSGKEFKQKGFNFGTFNKIDLKYVILVS